MRRGHPRLCPRILCPGGLPPEPRLQLPSGSPDLMCARAHARSPSAPRAPSVYFFLLLSFSHSEIGHGVEVTPGAASASDAKAAFPPQLRESIATIGFGGACRPHTAQEACGRGSNNGLRSGAAGSPLSSLVQPALRLPFLPRGPGGGGATGRLTCERPGLESDRLGEFLWSSLSPRVTCLPGKLRRDRNRRACPADGDCGMCFRGPAGKSEL